MSLELFSQENHLYNKYLINVEVELWPTYKKCSWNL